MAKSTRYLKSFWRRQSCLSLRRFARCVDASTPELFLAAKAWLARKKGN